MYIEKIIEIIYSINKHCSAAVGEVVVGVDDAGDCERGCREQQGRTDDESLHLVPPRSRREKAGEMPD